MTRELDQQNVWPPILHEGETSLERKERLSAEAEAKRINDMIDRQIEQDRLRREKDIGGKILLLGALPVAVASQIVQSNHSF